MLGPSDWMDAGGFVHRAVNLAVRSCCALVGLACTDSVGSLIYLQAGALVATCLMELWPRAQRLSSSAASAGAATGVIATGLAAGVSLLLTRPM
jgi:hypothetical protein